jgi:hypothetical protein
MRFSPITLLGLATPIWAAVIPDTNITSQTLVARGEGSCGDTSLPIEWMYNMGVYGFCDAFEKSPDNPIGIKAIPVANPLVFTQVLKDYKTNKDLNWVYKIWVKGEGTYPPSQWCTYEKCVRKMKEILSEGQLGREYCVVDGTKDVLFQSGRIEEPIRALGGKLVFESYRRSDYVDKTPEWG